MMKETDLTIEQIETILVGTSRSVYDVRRNLVFPNVSWGFLNHEADLLVITNARKLIEIEIKRTLADFMADFKKDHTHYDRKLSYFYYAVPESIGQRVFDWLYEGEYKADDYYDSSKVIGYTDHNPHKCGLIVYGDPRGNLYPKGYCQTVLSRQMNNYLVTTEDELRLLRLGNMRVWNMKKKLAEYQAEPSMFKL